MKVTELYRIVVDQPGASDASETYTNLYLWNNSDEDIVYNEETYEPVALSRGDIVQNGEINRANVRFNIAPDNPLAQLYNSQTPDVVATVTIFRQEDNETYVWWKGRIASTSCTDWECVVDCESVFTGMRRTGARARYQVQCRHALYGRACGVNKEDYRVDGTVTAVDRTNITVTYNASEEPSSTYFVGGIIEYNGVMRFIVSQTGGNLKLWRPMPNLEINDSVSLYPGCNRSLITCDSKFDNAINHGGFPWLPNVNPFKFTNVY
jgi:uncharacterized phage protein (TIGR02218 family)